MTHEIFEPFPVPVGGVDAQQLIDDIHARISGAFRLPPHYVVSNFTRGPSAFEERYRKACDVPTD